MAPVPTIQRPGAAGTSRPSAPSTSGASRPGAPGQDKRKPTGSEDKMSDLIVRVKYCNTLPDIPFDPKFLSYSFERNRFIEYAPTSLERSYKYELLTEHDLGVNVDLILPEAYEKVDDSDELDPKDERLIEEDDSRPVDVKRKARHAQILSWMRRPDYISTEQTRYQPTTIDKVEARVGFSVRKKMGDKMHAINMDREAQIEKIEETFEAAKLDIKEHYSKKGVYPVEVLPVLPDDKMWKYPCAQVIFDSDPAPTSESTSQIQQNEMMSQAMIRGVMDESGEQFVAYFLPTQETMEKRQADFVAGRDYDDEGEYEYKMFREYNWNVKSKTTKGYEENYFFVCRDEGLFYNELETRVRLSKRRLKQGQQQPNSRLVVRHRPLSKTETKMQRYREKLLEPPGEEEEEMSEDEEEEEEQIKDTHGDEDDDKRSSSSRSSRSRSKSKSRSRSGSPASSRSRSASGSRSRSRSVSRSKSRSVSRSPRSKSKSRSRSGSSSRSRSPLSRASSAASGSPRSRSGSDSD